MAQVDELFPKNERLITYLDSPSAGRLAVVKVGATLVGRISVTYDRTITTNAPGKRTMRSLTYDPPRLLQKGAELGAFELGSTVILVCEPDRVLLDGLTSGAEVRMGQRIGTVKARRAATKRLARGRTRRRGKSEAANKG